MHFAGERLAAPVLLAQIGQHTLERPLRLREIPGALTSCANARQNAYALHPSWEPYTWASTNSVWMAHRGLVAWRRATPAPINSPRSAPPTSSNTSRIGCVRYLSND